MQLPTNTPYPLCPCTPTATFQIPYPATLPYCFISGNLLVLLFKPLVLKLFACCLAPPAGDQGQGAEPHRHQGPRTHCECVAVTLA